MSVGIRTITQLQEAMAKESAWRKKELHGLKALVIGNKDKHHGDLYVRAATTLLYAHWEGFVKKIGTFYLEFVARHKLKHEKLPDNFLAMAIRRLVHGATESTKIEACVEVVKFFRSQLSAESSLAWKGGINTKSNLKAAVFKDIVTMLGLDYSVFATKEKLIDERLLRNRNEIAHGQFLLLKADDYLDIHGQVFQMMDDFYTQIENSAITGAFKIQ